jgi:phage terminase small subunit
MLNELAGPARLLVKSKRGSPRINPLIRIVNDSQRAATFYAGLLGLTPSGRASLGAQQEVRTDDFSEFFS